jgi:hypothetical protein
MRENQYRGASFKLELVISLRLIKESSFVNFYTQGFMKVSAHVENLQNFEKSIIIVRLNRHIFM